jgi:hypothetical protein
MIHWIHKDLLLLIILISFCPVETSGQEEKVYISGSFNNVSFENFIKEIEDQHLIRFYYNPDWLDSIEVTGNFDHHNLKDVFSIILKNTTLKYHYYNGNVFLTDHYTLKTDFFDKDNWIPTYKNDTTLSNSYYAQIQLLDEITDKIDGNSSENIELGRQNARPGVSSATISGTIKDKQTGETLTGIVIHTSFSSRGNFACSNPLLNRIQQITRWSYIGNYHGIPTDCPHREKIGWTGDGHLVAETGLYNYNTTSSYIKWLDDHVDEQQPDGNLPGVIPTSGWGYLHGKDKASRHLGYGPSWEGSLVLIPWYLYVYTGDTAILRRYYRPIKNYIDHLERNAKNYLLDTGIDDHKAFFTKTEGDIIASGYFYYLTDLLARMAKILSQAEESMAYGNLASQIKQSFLAKYYDMKSKTVGNGGQTCLSQGLYMYLVPDKDRQQVLNNLLAKIDSADYHFDAGVGGVKALFEALSSSGQDQILYQMVNQKDFPGYGYWIEQGANTLWQDWDGSMSLNHIMFGSVSEWFFQSLAGINPDPKQPGFKNVIIKPRFINDLQWVNGEFEINVTRLYYEPIFR